jgi:hypothetical protein
MPGTDTKVTPDREDPIIPKATIYHGDLRLPKKKASLPECFFPMKWEIRNKVPKYSRIMTRISVPFMF